MTTVNHPRSVVTGVSILYVSLLLNFVSGLINIIHTKYGMSILNLTNAPAPLSPLNMLITVAVTCIVFWFVISQINKGHQWARVIYLIFIILVLLAWSMHFEQVAAQGIFALIASIVNTVLGIIGMICLFSSSSNEWFKNVKKNRQNLQ